MEAPTSVRQSIESATCRRSSSASLRWASSPRSGAAGPSLPGATAPFQVKTPARAFAPVTARAGVQEAPCRFRINRSRTGRFPWVPAIWTFYFLAFCSRRYSCSIHRKSPAVGNVIKLRISQKRVRYYPVPGSFFDGISTIFLKSTKKCLTKRLFYAAKS